MRLCDIELDHGDRVLGGIDGASRILSGSYRIQSAAEYGGQGLNHEGSAEPSRGVTVVTAFPFSFRFCFSSCPPVYFLFLKFLRNIGAANGRLRHKSLKLGRPQRSSDHQPLSTASPGAVVKSAQGVYGRRAVDLPSRCQNVRPIAKTFDCEAKPFDLAM